MRKYFTTLIVLAAACGTPASQQANTSDTLAIKNGAEITPDLAQPLFDSARTVDTIEYSNWSNGHFLYFRSGRFLVPDITTAVVAESKTDSTIGIQLWTLHQEIWTLQSEQEFSGPGMSFRMNYADYNFDGQTDIYHTVSCSNGFSQCYGNLLLVDPFALEMTPYAESHALGNMRPDPAKQCVHSTEVIWCKNNGLRDTCLLTGKWINDSIVTIAKTCPCETE